MRHIKRQPQNELFLGSRHVATPFANEYKRLFNTLVYDATPYLQVGFDRENYCVPASILLIMHARLGPKLRSLNITKMKEELDCFDCRNYISLGDLGMNLQKIHEFEKSLSPIPTSLLRYFPALRIFKGLAINLFTIRRVGTAKKIFPVSLSPNHKNTDTHFMCDLLIETAEIRPPSTTLRPNHVLAITNLSALMTRFSDKMHNYNKYKYICRNCLQSSMTNLTDHFKVCQSRTRTAALSRRKSKNILLHSPQKYNRFSGKMERNGLHFSKGKNFLMIRPSSLVFYDFESYNKRCNGNREEGTSSGDTFEKTPSGAIMSLPVLSFAYLHVSLYDNHPLPESLKKPRFKRIEEENLDPVDAERQFFLSLLLNLRFDLLLHHFHVQNIVQNDQGPPPSAERTLAMIKYMASVTNCHLCGATFGWKRVSHITKKKYVVKRTFDHSHYSEGNFPSISGGLRCVLCQVKQQQMPTN